MPRRAALSTAGPAGSLRGRRRAPALPVALAVAALGTLLAPAPASAIVGGRPLDVASTPWLVQVRVDGDQVCTGSLVRPRVVLTAAHCLEGSLPTSVAFGRRSTSGSDGEVVPVGRYGVYERYTRNQRRRSTSLQADVAILELKRAPADPVVIGLADAGDRSLVGAGRRATASGWGVTAGSRNGSRILRTVRLPIRSSRLCRAFLNGGGYRSTSLLCAGSSDRTAGACFGDSGGPLYTTRNGVPLQLGVATSTTTRTCRRSATIYNQTLRGTTREWLDATIARSESTAPAPDATARRGPISPDVARG